MNIMLGWVKCIVLGLDIVFLYAACYTDSCWNSFRAIRQCKTLERVYIAHVPWFYPWKRPNKLPRLQPHCLQRFIIFGVRWSCSGFGTNIIDHLRGMNICPGLKLHIFIQPFGSPAVQVTELCHTKQSDFPFVQLYIWLWSIAVSVIFMCIM